MRAMEIAVRAAGRIVVWVQAAAEVSTAKIKSLPMPEPSTSVASGARKSSPLNFSSPGSAKATAATATIT